MLYHFWARVDQSVNGGHYNNDESVYKSLVKPDYPVVDIVIPTLKHHMYPVTMFLYKIKQNWTRPRG